jgi:tetratricopeptide (TPR) repeat protein
MPSGFCPSCLLHTVLETEGDDAAGSHIEDYELLNEVARGGMGIVYRARQRTPSRIVALKMILPAHLTSLGAVNRFHTEAEAAASLDHECVLPVYAVGEGDGAPFYSMKFAEGGPLSARMDDYRNKPRDAAALIAKLARAVAYAHEQGILHRDLKPGNVLFDSAGKPYVGDFGLAKWLQCECDLTQTLAILGTPYYMAPEQAKDSKAVTAAADIYSLGAILFHLLAGRPPVDGETPLEVLHRAAHQTPRLTNRSSIPRDLGVICLKCLEKEPGARYESAAALADDLENFCADRPIRARPIGLTIRGWRWTKRNPLVAGLAVSLIALLLVLIARDQAQRAEERKPTRNPQAYALYTRGVQAMRRPPADPKPLEEAQHLFEQAIGLDPRFALAHAQLSRVHSLLYALFSQEKLQKNRANAEANEALRLRPELGEAHLARAVYLSRVENDYDRALKEFDIAQAALPNDPFVFHGRGHTQLRRGKFPEAIADFERATELDPMSWNMFDMLANTYYAVGNYSGAERAKKRAFELVSETEPLAKFIEEESWAWMFFYLTGRFDKLDEVLARAPLSHEIDPGGDSVQTVFFDRLCERKYPEAEETLRAFPATIFDIWSGARVTKNFLLGIVAMVQGDNARARPLFESELQFAEQELRANPNSPVRQAQLGTVLAYLGRKAEAIAAGQRALELMPVSKDASDGPGYLVRLAEIYGRVGETDKAIDLLEKSMKIPASLPPADLEFWMWDPLREHPRFRNLAAPNTR